MKITALLLALLALPLLPPSAEAKPCKDASNTAPLLSLPLDVRVEARSEFPVQHTAAIEMRRLRVEAVELRRLAARFAARRMSSQRR